MTKNSLLKTNQYLKSPEKLYSALCRSVETSSAIEGIHVSVKKAEGQKKFIVRD